MRLLGGSVSGGVGQRLGGGERDLGLSLGVVALGLVRGVSWGGREREAGVGDLGGVRRLGDRGLGGVGVGSWVKGLGHLRLGLREVLGLGDRRVDVGLRQRGPFSVGLRLVLQVGERGLGLGLHLGHRGWVCGQRRLGLVPIVGH